MSSEPNTVLLLANAHSNYPNLRLLAGVIGKKNESSASPTSTEENPQEQQQTSTTVQQEQEQQQSTYVPPPPTASHVLLSDPNISQLLLEYHFHRNEVRRAMNQCDQSGEPIPKPLRRVLDAMLQAHVDTNTSLAAHGQQRTPSPSSSPALYQSPIRSAAADSPSRGGNNQSVATAAPHHPRPSYQHLVSTTPAAKVFQTAATDPSIAQNPNLTVSAATQQQKQLLNQAHEARRSGRPRDEICLLVELLTLHRHAPSVDAGAMFRVMRRLGDAHAALAEWDAAEQYFFEWYLLAQRLNTRASSKDGEGADPTCPDAQQQAVLAMTNMGKTRQARGDFAGAQQWFEKAHAGVH